MKKYDTMHITLLVHSKIVVFEWGKAIIDLFSAQSVKKRYAFTLVYDVEDLSECTTPVIIIGVYRSKERRSMRFR